MYFKEFILNCMEYIIDLYFMYDILLEYLYFEYVLFVFFRVYNYM